MAKTPLPVHVSADQLVSRLFAVIDGERWDELGTVFDRDAVCHRPGAEPLVGLAAIEDFYRHKRPIVSGRHELTRVVSDLDAAACWGRFTGRDQAGNTLDVRVAEAYLVRNGLITERTTYLHRH